MILGAILDRFCVRFGFVCNLMKTRKIARRPGESTTIEDLGDRKCCKFPKKTHRKYAQKLKRQMIPKWSQFGCQMEPKWRQEGIQKVMFFLMVFQMPLETSAELRGMREYHTFSSRPPRAAPYYQRLLYNNKQRRVAPEDLTRLGPLARRIVGAFGIQNGFQTHVTKLPSFPK